MKKFQKSLNSLAEFLIGSKNRFLKISLDLHTLYVYVCMSAKGAIYGNQ